eukprot:4629534-Alexandrium_andersonii.AAC.1
MLSCRFCGMLSCRFCSALSGLRQIYPLQIPPCKAWSGGCDVILSAESDGDDETGQRARWRRLSEGFEGAEPPSGRGSVSTNPLILNPGICNLATTPLP